MTIKRGTYKTMDGVFKSWNGTDYLKEVRYYDIIVFDFGGVEITYLSQMANEKHYTLDRETVDHIEDPLTEVDITRTRTSEPFIGFNINDIVYRMTLGLSEPVCAWYQPLTEVTLS